MTKEKLQKALDLLDQLLADYSKDLVLSNERTIQVSELACEGKVRSFGKTSLCIECQLSYVKNILKELLQD